MSDNILLAILGTCFIIGIVVLVVALVVLVLLLTLLAVVLFHFLSPPKDLSLLLPQKPEISLQQKQQKGLSAWKACAKMEN